MVLYEYKRKPGIRIPGYKFFHDTGLKFDHYLENSVFYTDIPEVSVDDNDYAIDSKDMTYYPIKGDKGSNFILTKCIDSVVVPQCKMGLGVYQSPKSDEEIYHLNTDDHLLLRMGFMESNNGTIWATVTVFDDDGNVVVENGYIVYKNNRNNYANVYITGMTIHTVLTNGKVDTDKVQRIKDQSPLATFSAEENEETSNTTTNDIKSPIQITQTPKAARVVPTINTNAELNKARKNASSKSDSGYTNVVLSHGPAVVQNNASFPPYRKIGDKYVYDYSMNYQLNSSFMNFTNLRKNLNMDTTSIRDVYKKNITEYNRFKIANPDDTLSKGFMHIFFLRPDLNILQNDKLTEQCKNNPLISTMWKKKPDLLKQLVLANGMSHDYMYLLSNRVNGFNLVDSGLDTESYGKSIGAYTVKFARRKDSELGGTIDLNFTDTRDLDIINLHKIWLDYAANVYRGIWSPKLAYINAREIDYATAIYVIVTAEDGETILFWSKYYGVFPVNVPYNALSWSANSVVSKPDLGITYDYAWKEDYNPAILTELNINTFRRQHPKTQKYIPIFDEKTGHSGYTWTGAPFVESVSFKGNNVDPTNGSKYVLKLRFKY